MPVTSEAAASRLSDVLQPRMSRVSAHRQGNVFDSVHGPGPRLTIVFGHVGYNFMAPAWLEFRATVPGLEDVVNPFSEIESPFQLDSSTWLWLVPAERNNGLTDADLFAKLDFILDWAKQRRVRFVVTNGIRDVDHIPNRMANRASNRRRTAMLTTYMAQRERTDRLKIELVSLNDDFMRYWVE